jgi:hypothetical protein
MQLGIGPHLDDTDLEQYAMGTLLEDRLAPFEEHFLACDSCQDRLLEMEAFVNAMRSASPKLRPARSSRWRRWFNWPRPVWVAAVLASVLLLATARMWMVARRGPVEVAAVFLQSSRGIEGLALANTPAGKPLSFHIDVTELAASPSYRLEVVDALGKPVWQTVTTSQHGNIVQPLTNGLSAGQYYVRLYGASGELLREFGLRAR